MNRLSYKEVVEGHDTINLIYDYQKVLIWNNCQYLTLSLTNSNDPKVKPKWLEFCQKAINTLSKVGIDFLKHPRKVTAWNIAFREKNNFPYRDKIDRLPPFLHKSKYFVQRLNMYGNTNLYELSSKIFQ